MTTPCGWTAVVVGGPASVRPALSDMIAAQGGTVVGSGEGQDALALAERLAPDVLVVVGPEPVGADVARRARCPVLVLAGVDTLRPGAAPPQGGAAPVVGTLSRPVRAGELRAALAAASGPLDALAALREEVRALQRRLDGRKLVERAKGVLMDRLGLAEPEAFRRIQKTAMDTRRTMGDVAQAILLSEDATRARPAGPPRAPAHAAGSARLELPAS